MRGECRLAAGDTGGADDLRAAADLAARQGAVLFERRAQRRSQRGRPSDGPAEDRDRRWRHGRFGRCVAPEPARRRRPRSPSTSAAGAWGERERRPAGPTDGLKSTGSTSGSVSTTTPSACCARAMRSSIGQPPIRPARSRTGATRSSRRADRPRAHGRGGFVGLARTVPRERPPAGGPAGADELSAVDFLERGLALVGRFGVSLRLGSGRRRGSR